MKTAFLKPSKGATFTEYAMLVSLIGGIAIVAALSIGESASRAINTSALTLASSMPTASAPADPAAPGQTETPAEPAPVVPVVLYAETEYTLHGVWMPLVQPPATGGRFNAYTPETLTLRVRANSENGDLNALNGAFLGSERLERVNASGTLEYQTPGSGPYDDNTTRMSALVLQGSGPQAFVVPKPRNAAESAAVADGTAYRVYTYQSRLTTNAVGEFDRVSFLRLDDMGTTTVWYDCAGRTVSVVGGGTLTECPND